MTIPTNTEAEKILKAKIRFIHDKHYVSNVEAGLDITDKNIDSAIEDTMQLIKAHTAKAVEEALENVEQSIKSHTVPESRSLLDRNYMLKTIEFEKRKSQEESDE